LISSYVTPTYHLAAKKRDYVAYTMATHPKYDNFTFPITNADSGSGHPGHTTPEQDEKVAQLRAELEAEDSTERLDTLTMVRTACNLLLRTAETARGL
jgi:hypothetical protein